MVLIIPKQESNTRKTSEKQILKFPQFRYYLRARLLYPKNGKSCKQLAILAVMTVREYSRHLPIVLLDFTFIASTTRCDLLLCSSTCYDSVEWQCETKSHVVVWRSTATSKWWECFVSRRIHLLCLVGNIWKRIERTW